MKFWWITDQQRLAEERRVIGAIVNDEAWFKLDCWSLYGGNLTVTGVITAHGIGYPVRLLYPDQFPQVPAWVVPQEDAKWSTHQYGSGGSLCLELRPDNWVSTATGADVLRSAYNLLVHENPLGETSGLARAPSAHHVGEIQAYDWGANPVLIGAACRDRLNKGESHDLKALRWMAADEVWPIMVHDSQDQASPRHPPGADLYSLRFEIPAYVSLNAAPPDADDRQDLIEAGDFDPLMAEQIGKAGAALVLFTGGAELVAYHLLDEGKPHLRKVFVMPDQGEVRSGRKPEARGKRVAIIGVGSVGSKIADSLLRSSVSNLTLIDGDVLLPVNLERHVLDWRAVGFRKVQGLRRHLLDIVPGADIKAVAVNLNWQRSARNHAGQVALIADCDVIVDATGDAATSLFLGAVAAANQRPFISVEVYEGGIGALVASCLPNRDPPFEAARAAFLAWCEQAGAIPPLSGHRPYEALDDDGVPLVADDASVSMAAGHATRVILDILDGLAAGQDEAWLLIGFRKGWVFEGHGHTIRMSVGDPVQPAVEFQDDETAAFVSALVEEHLSANSAGA